MENTNKINIYKIVLFSFSFISFNYAMESGFIKTTPDREKDKLNYFDLLPAEILRKIFKASADNINFEIEDSIQSSRIDLNSLLSRAIKSGYNLSSTNKRMRAFKKFVDERIRNLLISKYGEFEFIKRLFEAASGLHDAIFYAQIRKYCDDKNLPRKYLYIDLQKRIDAENKRKLSCCKLIKKFLFIGIQFPVDIRATDEMGLSPYFLGLTPLLVACTYSNVEMVKLLIALKCKLDIKNVHGKTALELSRGFMFRDILDFDVTEEDPITGKFKFKRHVITLSGERVNPEIQQLLINAGADTSVLKKTSTIQKRQEEPQQNHRRKSCNIV